MTSSAAAASGSGKYDVYKGKKEDGLTGAKIASARPTPPPTPRPSTSRSPRTPYIVSHMPCRGASQGWAGGSVLDVADFLAKHVNKEKFVVYTLVPTGPLEPARILPRAKFWRDFRQELHYALTGVSQTMFEQALTIVQRRNGITIKKNGGNIAKWSEKMAKMLRAQARHIAQTEGKHPSTPWLVELNLDDKPVSRRGTKKVTVESDSTATDKSSKKGDKDKVGKKDKKEKRQEGRCGSGEKREDR